MVYFRTNEDFLVSCWIEKLDGRKAYLKSEIRDVKGQLFVEATALFVKVNWGVANWQNVKNNIESSAPPLQKPENVSK